jgi:hypothetical protein
LKEYFPVALAEAVEWHPDAFLFWSQIEMRDESRLIYIFESPAFPGEWLRVEIALENNESAVHSHEGYIEEPRQDNQPIPLQDSLLDSTDVVDLALALGGQAFIDRHPEARNLLIQLAPLSGSAAEDLAMEGKLLVWRVGFFSIPTRSIDLYFDPFTGGFLGSIVRD